MSTYSPVLGLMPFTFAEATAAGITRAVLRSLVQDEVIRRVVRGAYVDAAVPDSLQIRAAAVAKVAPAGRVVCLRTAGWLWGVDVLAMGAHLLTPPVDLMAPSAAAGPRRAGCKGRTGALRAEDTVQLGTVCLTTPARTTADLLRLLRRPDALAAADAMLRTTGVTKSAIAGVLKRFVGQRGVVPARELLALADGRSESPQESRTRLRCVDAGFPCPEPQILLRDAFGAFLARLDMGYLELRKAIEFDGDEAHRTQQQVLHDRQRRERVEDEGWAICVVGSGDVLGHGHAFERAVGELLGMQSRLTRHHPRYGGWDRHVPGGL